MRFPFVPLLLLACALSSISAYEFIDVQGLGRELLTELHAPARPLFSHATLLNRIATLGGNDHDNDDYHECHPCVRHVAKHILNVTLEKIEKNCDHPKPIWKKRCEWIADHEEQLTGYLVVKLRPAHSGYMYCAGAKQCPVHPKNDTQLMLLDGDIDWHMYPIDPVVLEGIQEFIQESERDREANGIDVAEYLQQSNDDVMEYDDDDDDDDEGHGGKRCLKCNKHVIKKQLKCATKHLAKWCEHQKKKEHVKFCEWAKEHKKFVRGMIYGHLDPYKFAAGYCIGKGRCHRKPNATEVFDQW